MLVSSSGTAPLLKGAARTRVPSIALGREIQDTWRRLRVKFEQRTIELTTPLLIAFQQWVTQLIRPDLVWPGSFVSLYVA